MPGTLFKRALDRSEQGFSAVESTARLCRTSLTATAIRYAELTDDAVAVVVSTGKSIDYCFLSEIMKSLPEITWLRKGTPIPQGAATAEFNADPARVANADRTEADIDIMDWIGGTPVR